ncbi:hypothetical protein F0562_016819 [Nyssa sinensis]|uniref:Uncharacterized protein n=1 Tax=Nyssa sinensis TaxID=561372 RepID=A0A5J4ZDE6_9ASTE|nr:hypothetical protein F0562_016819 [Nyssa sinensis]
MSATLVARRSGYLRSLWRTAISGNSISRPSVLRARTALPCSPSREVYQVCHSHLVESGFKEVKDFRGPKGGPYLPLELLLYRGLKMDINSGKSL